MTTMHASCAARDEDGVLLLGPPGSGKSDLLLRLLDIGFEMVGDDRIEVTDGWARPALTLAGLLEVRGLGIMRLPYRSAARLALAVKLGNSERLPAPARHPLLDLPLVSVDPTSCSAPRRVALAFECALGRMSQVSGAFAA
jgi:HPr kinase/phosphorylase